MSDRRIDGRVLYAVLSGLVGRSAVRAVTGYFRRQPHNERMLTRRLGSTGLSVTSLGLGLAALGRPGYITGGRGADRSVPTLRLRTHEVLDAAYAVGIRYFDVARSYGLAEEFLASWLAQRSLLANAVTVGSKWGYTYTAGWRVDSSVHEVKDHSLNALMRQLAESRGVLGRHLRHYQVHSATLESGVLEDRRVLAELVRLRQQGLTIGLSLSGPEQALAARRALAVQVDGLNPFSCVQATWNLLETSAGTALAEAHSAGWGVIIKEALANGRLAARGTEPGLSFLWDVAKERGSTPDAVAIAAAMAQPWADVVLSGAASAAQVQSNGAAAELTLSEGDLARLDFLAGDPIPVLGHAPGDEVELASPEQRVYLMRESKRLPRNPRGKGYADLMGGDARRPAWAAESALLYHLGRPAGAETGKRKIPVA